jgi:hypothetical protein
MILVIYLILCFAVGIVGRQRPIGFVGYFMFSFLFTPLLMLMILMITRPNFQGRPEALCPNGARRCRAATSNSHCSHRERPL